MKDDKRSCSAGTRRAIRSWVLEKMVSLAPHRWGSPSPLGVPAVLEKNQLRIAWTVLFEGGLALRRA